MLNIVGYNFNRNIYAHNNTSKQSTMPKLKELTCDTVSFLGVNRKIELPEGNNKGTLYRKVLDEDDEITKEPFEVDIVPLRRTKDNIKYSFYDDMTRVGFVELMEIYDPSKYEEEKYNKFRTIYDDYEKENIKGERLAVLLLQNLYPNEICGVGELADRIAVEHCMRCGIKPTIVSYAIGQSHLPHYLRGKRFIQLPNQINMNEEMEKLASTRKPHEHINTSRYSVGNPCITYIPTERVNELSEEIKKYPLLKEEY